MDKETYYVGQWKDGCGRERFSVSKHVNGKHEKSYPNFNFDQLYGFLQAVQNPVPQKPKLDVKIWNGVPIEDFKEELFLPSGEDIKPLEGRTLEHFIYFFHTPIIEKEKFMISEEDRNKKPQYRARHESWG